MPNHCNNFETNKSFIGFINDLKCNKCINICSLRIKE